MSAPSTQPVRSGVGSSTVVVKRRACDECRIRKLACTKEPDGCSRCKREGVACHYSAQKRMGRPKKHHKAGRAPEASPIPPDAPVSGPVTAQGKQVLKMPDAAMDSDPASLIDPSPNAADTGLLNLLGVDFTSIPNSQAQPPFPNYTPLDREIWNFDINFGSHYLPPIADSNMIPLSQLEAPPDLSTPNLTQRASPPVEVQYPPGHAHMPAPLPSGCSCLANLYLALDSLGHLPTEVGPAIRVARRALRVAHDAVQCQICSPSITETMKVLPITDFQNTMILGALLPSIAEAYQRILDMVELETARAIGGRRQLRFDLPGYGGLWGSLASFEHGSNGSRYRDAAMEPAMWRLTVRALLKTDVYGINYKPGGPDDCGGDGLDASHLGLRDIIAQMDERSRLRHAEVDALVEAGLLPPTGQGGMPVPHSHGQSGEEPPCRRIIKIAREAVDRLVVA